ncbi:hypothetical protein BLNAU_7645 [Blattamonas nauphoetae]|uniref:Uncharacterized protein n=1 Tax=Blattamonas nauphoetae TaxID=2049346 RepID=A0ABQ9Y1A5_9EUKA|nr:hypothetical protein BLNAU_7645 [Blattamonas nauphoetae]
MTLRSEGTALPIADCQVVFKHNANLEEMTLTIPFTSNHFTFQIHLTEQVLFVFDTTYQVITVSSSDGNVRFKQPTFEFVLTGPPELVSVHASLDETKESLILVLTGMRLPHGTCNMTLIRIDNNQPLSLQFNCFSDQISPTFTMSDHPQLEYGKEYRIMNMTVSSVNVILFSSLSFVIPALPRQGVIEELYATLSPDGQKGRIRIRGRGLEPGPIQFTLTDTPTHFHSAVFVSEGLFQVELPFGTSAGELQSGAEYTVAVLEVDFCVVSWNVNKTFTVPFPPNVVAVVAESNEIGIGVTIDLMGDYLRMEEDYIVTLLPSGSFVVHFNDSISASVELCFDGDDFDYSTTYTIDSIAHVDNPDHKMEVSAGEQTVWRGESTVQICGLGVGVVEPLSIEIVSIALLDESELTTPMEQKDGRLTHYYIGPNAFDTLTIPSTASLGENEAMIVVRTSFEMSQTEVLIEASLSKFVFLSAINATVTLKQGSIIGTPSSSTMNGDAHSQLCGWTSGHLSIGAFVVQGGRVMIDASKFSSNSPHFASFPSVSRNVQCSDDGFLDIQGLTGSDGTEESISSWIVPSDCVLSSPIVKLDSPFFIPKPRTDDSKSTWDEGTDTYHVEIQGTTLIPCGLFLKLDGQSETGEPTSTKIELIPSIATLFNETLISLDPPASAVSDMSTTMEIRARLVFGNSVATEELFAFPVRKVSSSGLGIPTWLIPVIVARRKEKQNVGKEGKEQSIHQVEEEKSDHIPFKHDDESILDDTRPALVLEPEETDQFDLKIDESEQERPHSIKPLEEPKQDPSFEMMVDISKPSPEQDGHDQLLDLDEKPKQKKEKKKRGVESLDEAVAPNSEGKERKKRVGEEEEILPDPEDLGEQPKKKKKKSQADDSDEQQKEAEEPITTEQEVPLTHPPSIETGSPFSFHFTTPPFVTTCGHFLLCFPSFSSFHVFPIWPVLVRSSHPQSEHASCN